MANCEIIKCPNRATQILSVGSAGRVETLCPNHVAQAVAPLDAGLVPYQLTGVEGSFSTEQSLDQRVKELLSDRVDLVAELDEAKHENLRLGEILTRTLEQQNADLRAELEALKNQNEHLAETEQPTKVG